MELSYPNNYKIMILHWMHNGTQLLPAQYYSLVFKTAKYSPKMDNIHSLRKIYFALNTLPSKTLDCSIWHVIPAETIPQAPKNGATSRSYLPKRHPTPNITPLAQSNSIMKLPMIYYNWAMNLHHNSNKFQIYALYRNNQWTAPQNTRI